MASLKVRREQIIELEIKAETLQKNGKYLECMDVMEEILNIKMYSYGENSEETLKTSEKLCELCNLVSMIFLQKEKFEAALDFLRKAEVLCQHSIQFKSVTLNNLGCFYRRTGKLRTSLHYLEQALDMELKLDNPTSVADTHLNLCAVLSQLNKHEEGLEHVLMAIVLLQDEFVFAEMSNRKHQNEVKNSENTENDEMKKDRESSTQNNNKKNNNNKKLEDRAGVLTIAYHNMGVELEFLKRYEECIKTYEKGIKFATLHLGNEHHLVQNLKQVLQTATKEINRQQVKEMKKKEEKEAIVNLKNEQRKKTPIIFTNDPYKRKSTTSPQQTSPQFSKTFNNTDNNKDAFHKKGNFSIGRTDQQRKVKTQQVAQRSSIKIRPLATTNYYAMVSEMRNEFNAAAGNNILVLPPVSSNNQNKDNNNHKNTIEGNKENNKLHLKNIDSVPFDSNSQSHIQSAIIESPNLKKAISKYSEVPETLDLNKDMSALTKEIEKELESPDKLKT